MYCNKKPSVLSQAVSASSCERNRSAHGHIQTKIRSSLDPAATEKIKLVCVYSNSRLVTAGRDAEELKTFAWGNEEI